MQLLRTFPYYELLLMNSYGIKLYRYTSVIFSFMFIICLTTDTQHTVLEKFTSYEATNPFLFALIVRRLPSMTLRTRDTHGGAVAVLFFK